MDIFKVRFCSSEATFSNFFFILLIVSAISCNVPEKAVAPERLFSFIPPEESGINFSNNIHSSDSLNILNYIYFFNGAGVGIIDINNDGLEDIFLAGNQVSSRLYLNLGNFKFRDITNSANVSTSRWCTGVSIVDINADGYSDIYVSVAGSADPEKRSNLLFINNKDETFTEVAEKYGINDNSYTTHAAFFDYDLDGDLDLYVLNHDNDRTALNTPLPKKVKGESANNDKLYQNNGPEMPFSDVTTASGITIEGFGLGVAVSDINSDGWPDIYISNDFISNDILYINNQDGTFTNRIANMLQEQTYNSMGSDVSDFNNDGLPDIVVVDMLPFDPVREKTMAGSMTLDKFNTIERMNYEPQFMRNTLQLNQGNNTFIEIGRFSGIHRTDWSWSPLFVDLDNDGWKDLFITNGYLKDITDKDFIDNNNNLSMFRNEEVKEKETLQRIEELEGIKLANMAFKNNTDLTFSDNTVDWGLVKESFSNGSAFSDLDNDGDLDLVINNINDPAFVIRNNSSEKSNYIQVSLKGNKNNPRALGAKVELVTLSGRQFAESTIYRGFMSTMSGLIHFGLGREEIIDTIKVRWLDGTSHTMTGLKPNQVIEIAYNQDIGKERNEGVKPGLKQPLIVEDTSLIDQDYTHQFSSVFDFKRQPLLPYRISGRGPVLATADFDNNGLDDLFISGDLQSPGQIFFQTHTGQFNKVALEGTIGMEITDAAAFDVNGDGFDDLYLASGSSIHPPGDEKYQDLLYLGGAKVTLAVGILPDSKTSSSCVKAGDFDGDGRPELFIGGYAEPHNFPEPAKSYILQYQDGEYVNITENVAPELSSTGMVTDAVWTDYNNDGRNDLIVVGEWMPIMFFENSGNLLENRTVNMNLKDNSGLWQSIESIDIDSDGDDDLIVGNRGLNSGYTASSEKPLRLYAPDLNNDGEYDPVMSFYVNETETIHPSREAFLGRLPVYRKKFPTHGHFAEAGVEDIVPADDPSKGSVLESCNLHSMILRNNGRGLFELDTLTTKAQLFPVRSILQMKAIDGSNILFLTGGGEKAVPDGSGFGISGILPLVIDGNNLDATDASIVPLSGGVSDMAILTMNDGTKRLIVGVADNDMKIYKINNH